MANLTGGRFHSNSIFLLFIIYFFFTLSTILLHSTTTLVQSSETALNKPIGGAVSNSGNYCKIPCIKERFDLGRDCVEAPQGKCQCVAHCCWAFDCRLWPVFANCRKRCRIQEWSRFGFNKGPAQCDHFRCIETHIIPWDLRNATDPKVINCIQHCCYAFNCKRFAGLCRDQCMQLQGRQTPMYAD